MTTPTRWFGAVTADVALDPEIPMTAKAVYLVLAVHADKTGACFVSNTKVAVALGVSRSTVMRSIQCLADAGVIERQARYVDGVQRSSITVLLDLTTSGRTRRD